MSEKENLSGKRDTETLILAKDSGKQFTSGGSGVHLRGGEWCSRCPLLDKHFYLHIKTPSAPKPETTAKKISSAILFTLKWLYGFLWFTGSVSGDSMKEKLLTNYGETMKLKADGGNYCEFSGSGPPK